MSDKESIPNFTLNNHLEGDDKKEPKVIKAGFIDSHLSSRRDFIKKGLFFGAGLVTSTSFLGCGGGDDNSSVASGAGPVQNISSECTNDYYFTHKVIIPSIAFSPDGSRIVSVSEQYYDSINSIREDFFVKVWETSTQKLLLKYEGHDSSVYDASFSPDGKKIATGGKDNIVHVWDASTGELLLKYEGHVPSATGSTVFKALAFSPDGTKIASSTYNPGKLHIWDSSTGELLLEYMGLEDIQTIAFHPDGTKIAAGGGAYWGTRSTTIHIFDISNGDLILKYEGHNSKYGMRKLIFSPDGTIIASISLTEKPVHIWDASDGKLLFKYEGHAKNIDGIAFSPDGTKIISNSYDQTIHIWDSSTGKILVYHEVEKPKYTSGLVTAKAVASSPDGKLIACSAWQYMFLIDSNSGEFLSYFFDTSSLLTDAVRCDIENNESFVGCTCEVVCNCDTVCNCDSVCSCHGVCACDPQWCTIYEV